VNNFKRIAEATIQIRCGGKRGSGFYFVKPDLVITNNHVIIDHKKNGNPIIGKKENHRLFQLQLLENSEKEDEDYAILKVVEKVFEGEIVLQPKEHVDFEIGSSITYSGFPLGIDNLIVKHGMISGIVDKKHFFIDGSINSGNSGGPIIEEGGDVIGIVTQSAFLGGKKLLEMEEAANNLLDHFSQTSQMGSVEIMGMDFSKISALMANSMILIKEVVQANANTGIGIGFSIDMVFERCKKENLL
jgi:S1-C subfamily serine protease